VRAREKKGHSCPAHTEEKGGKRDRSCLAFTRAGLGYIYRVQDNKTVYATRKQENGERGNERSGSSAGDKPRGVVCKKGSGDQRKSENECYVKARQRAQGRRERRRSKSDDRGVDRKLTKGVKSLR